MGLSTSSAFMPSDEFFVGIEPQRVYRYHVERQHQLRNHPNWQDFIAKAGSGWKARFDEKTGLPFRAWGAGISLAPIDSSTVAIQEVRSFLAEYPQFIGAKNTDMGTATYHASIDSWYVHFEQKVSLVKPAIDDINDDVISSAVVWRGGLDAYIKQNKLTMFGSHMYPQLDSVSFSPEVPASQAVEISVAFGPAALSEHQEIDVELVVLPLPVGNSIQHHLCWKVFSKTADPIGHWVSFVDAQSGDLLSVHNDVRFLEGSLHAEHDTRTINGDISTSPLPDLQLSSDADSTLTEVDGSYQIDGNSFDGALLRGLYTQVYNAGGDNFYLSLTGGEQIVAADDDDTLAQLDQFVFQNRIFNWSEEHAPHIVDNWDRSTVNVNLNDVCNAYFDGTLNFFRAGEGCNNTGRIADVSYHEWGHGFHYYNLLAGSYDGSMSEGIADSIAFFQTEDPFIAPYFGEQGWAIRRVDEDRVYPDDIVNEVHSDGLIFAGAIWDFWDIMEDRYGATEAYAPTVNIFVESLRSGPTIPQSYDSFVFADDDNGDLSDGTPHECEIIEAFGRHGLGPQGSGMLLQVSHLPIPTQSATATEYPLSADIVAFAENCIEVETEQAVVKYSTDNGESWSEVTLDLETESISGAIPQVEANTIVKYYLEIQDDTGGVVTSPEGGSINPFHFYVGAREQIYCNDFELDDGGFTHELLDGQQQEGADDWMWGTPIGLGGDPEFAASGDKVWGNDLGGDINGENYNGEYQNEKWNRLTSSAFDVSGYDQVVVEFNRWLTVEDGYYDQASVQANGEIIWLNHASRREIGDEHHRDNQWSPHSMIVDLDDSGSLTLSWDIRSDQGLSMGGWNIDDLCVYGVVEPANDEDLNGNTPKPDGIACGCSSTTNQKSEIFAVLFGLLIPLIRRRR